MYAAVVRVFEKRGRVYLGDCGVEIVKREGYEGYSEHVFDRGKEARLWEDSLKMVGLS